jgi:DNA-binding transcriptional ArsR family regulator
MLAASCFAASAIGACFGRRRGGWAESMLSPVLQAGGGTKQSATRFFENDACGGRARVRSAFAARQPTGPRPVNDIGDRLGLRQSQVSQHLKVLRDAGIVEVEPRAQQRLYRLRAQRLKQLHKWLDRYRRIWEERFEQLDELVEELKQKETSDATGKNR